MNRMDGRWNVWGFEGGGVVVGGGRAKDKETGGFLQAHLSLWAKACEEEEEEPSWMPPTRDKCVFYASG